MLQKWKLCISGACAGAITGILGAGGGLILVPMLSGFVGIESSKVFVFSLSTMIPICFTVLLFHADEWLSIIPSALPFLIGSALGGIAATVLGQKIPVLWLHRILGLFILWGGFRYLC